MTTPRNRSILRINSNAPELAVLIDDFYTPSDGGDWVFAAERAQEVSRSVRFGKRQYDLSRCIIHKSGTNWIGSGPETIVRNTRQASSNLLHGAFFFGNMHPAAFRYSQQGLNGYLPCDDIEDTVSGKNTIILKNSDDYSNYLIGSSVFIRAISETLVGGFYPLCI